MLISKIGEFSLIERFRKSISTDSSVFKGSGDDCAVLEFNKDYYQLFTCDMIVEGVDFTPRTEPSLIGRKALAVSISDIAACGGIPRHTVVSLGIPRNTSVSYIDKLSKGLFSLAKEYKVNVVGGDLSRSRKVVLDVSMLGLVEKKYLVLRSTAREGDIIFVTGKLGGSIEGRHLEFTPRIKEARYLVENFKVNSMIDISDGLGQDLHHILKESNVGAVIYENSIPLSKQARGIKDALFMGEDFELLFTLSSKEAGRLLKKKQGIFTAIGKITDKRYGVRLIGENNKERFLLSRGFRHF